MCIISSSLQGTIQYDHVVNIISTVTLIVQNGALMNFLIRAHTFDILTMYELPLKCMPLLYYLPARFGLHRRHTY